MKITLLQTDIRWGAQTDNMAVAAQLMDAAPGADLYVLPEMWNTGFVADAPATVHEVALFWMQERAVALRAAVCGSMAVRTVGGQSVNRLFFVKPDGNVATYDKHHLFRYGGEDQFYEGGNERTVVEWRGVRFLLCVCYDLRFPVWLRYRGDYDAIICVANWPDSRQSVWHTLLRARAIENQCYVVGCNRTGDDPHCHYLGHSAVIDSRGVAMAEDTTERPTTVTADIDVEQLRQFRAKFRVLDDRDNFEFAT